MFSPVRCDAESVFKKYLASTLLEFCPLLGRVLSRNLCRRFFERVFLRRDSQELSGRRRGSEIWFAQEPQESASKAETHTLGEHDQLLRVPLKDL